MYSNTVADNKSDFCASVNVKLKQIKPVKAISHRRLSLLREQVAIRRRWLTCNLVIFHQVQYRFETAGGGTFYFIMRSVMCVFDNMSKMLYAPWQWDASRERKPSAFERLKLFHGQWSRFLCPRNRDEKTDQLARSQLRGQGSTWNKLPLWETTCCMRRYTTECKTRL